MAEPDVRKECRPVSYRGTNSNWRYRSRFIDPAFAPLQAELDAIVAAPGRLQQLEESPFTRKAGKVLPTPNTRSPSTGSRAGRHPRGAAAP